MFTFKKITKITLISTALIAFSGGAFATSNFYDYGCTTPDSPSPQVCFYTGEGYTGNWYCESGDRTVSKVDKAPWKNNIESIKFINGASVKIYNEYNRMGDYKLIERNTKELSVEFFNKVKSYRTVMPYIEEQPTPPSWWYQEMCTHQYEY
ncbi:MAG: peptidase inhibitor family I36 protein [Devosiaceae bacterium]|nr:peptidase inhibitor family I36 protein [Devosiaceae bacterium]